MNKEIKPSIASTMLTICIGSLLSLFFIFIILPSILIGFLFLIAYVHSIKDNISETYLYKLENNIDIENRFHYNAFNSTGTNTLSLIPFINL